MQHDPVVVGIMHPLAWEARPRHEVDADLDQLTHMNRHDVQVIEVRYTEPTELRRQRSAAPTADLRHLAPTLTDEQRNALAQVEVALALDLPFDVGRWAPRLCWVQGLGAGVGQLLSAGLADHGIRLTTAAGTNAVSISEFVFARLLQTWKRLPEIDRYQRDHRWKPRYGTEVAGRTLGVVGLGAIGRRIAKLGRAFGMHVVASRQSYTPGGVDPDVDRLYGPTDLHEMLGGCDAVVLAAAETPDTFRLFDAAAFAAMPEGSVFCNISRGSLVDEAALADALRSAHLAGASVDVVSDEPLKPHAPLWDVPALFVSAHCASSIDSFWPNVHALFRDNLRRYLSGESLRNEVDLSGGR